MSSGELEPISRAVFNQFASFADRVNEEAGIPPALCGVIAESRSFRKPTIRVEDFPHDDGRRVIDVAIERKGQTTRLAIKDGEAFGIGYSQHGKESVIKIQKIGEASVREVFNAVKDRNPKSFKRKQKPNYKHEH